MLDRIRADRARTRPSRATSSSASAARRKTTSSRRSTWSARRGSRTASSSSTARGPAPRPPSSIDDDVPEDVKRRRNNELLAVQNAISLEDNRPLVGRTVEILVEGPSKAARSLSPAPGETSARSGLMRPETLIRTRFSQKAGRTNQATVQLTGRTACDRIVVFDGSPSLVGHLVRVTIDSASSFTLFARPAEITE